MVGQLAHGQEAQMLRLLFAVTVLIAAAMIAGVYFNCNPVILIFLILGIGLYGVTRMRGPLLPGDGFR
jgi:hypothetical protein